MDYILSEIRLKGNAYGAWLTYDPRGRILYFGSYRDPHVARTLDVFDGVMDFARQANWTQTDIDRAIIATAKNEERPIRPQGRPAGLYIGIYLALRLRSGNSTLNSFDRQLLSLFSGRCWSFWKPTTIGVQYVLWPAEKNLKQQAASYRVVRWRFGIF